MPSWRFGNFDIGFFYQSTLIRGVRVQLSIHLFLFSLMSLLFSCSPKDEDVLKVRHYHLQEVDLIDKDAEMARGEQLYRIRGAVTMKERIARKGHYYTVTWNDDQPGAGNMTVVMEYLQSATAAQILRMSRDLPEGEKSGKMEFLITGESYRVGGPVLAWRIQLLRDGELMASQQSYLWK